MLLAARPSNVAGEQVIGALERDVAARVGRRPQDPAFGLALRTVPNPVSPARLAWPHLVNAILSLAAGVERQDTPVARPSSEPAERPGLAFPS